MVIFYSDSGFGGWRWRESSGHSLEQQSLPDGEVLSLGSQWNWLWMEGLCRLQTQIRVGIPEKELY